MRHDLFDQLANARALAREQAPQVWSVSQVNALARELLEGAFPPLWVAGEVSGFKRYPSGHCYFTLKDETGQLNCVMWREAARALPAEPPEGMAVHVFGYLTIYQRAGRFQFVTRELMAHGEGLWRIAFERARKKLEAEGLLDPERKRPLPAYPSCVGVVTSVEGAAVRDIVSIIRRRAPWTHIVIYPTRVQGEGAAESIVAALRQAGRAARADVLIVGRGGGSAEDLRAFNDEAVARAIARSPLPVISAVGHETDVTLADLVADCRAPTPSAAAEITVPDRERLCSELANSRERMATALLSGVTRGVQRVERLEQQLLKAMGDALQRHQLVIGGLRHRLQALGPMEVLRRGYALALDDRGRVLRGVADFTLRSTFVLRLRDGRVQARTESMSEEV